MDEALRLDYLEAMGITQYVARAPLPGACPSPVIEQLVTADNDEAETVTASAVLATLVPVSIATPDRPARMADLLAAEPARPAAPRAAASPPAAATIHSEPTTATTGSFQCQLALWTAGDLLVIADMPRLDNQQQTLLRNILQAIGRPDTLGAIRQYTWPQGRDRSLHAAREHFQGLLDGGPLQQPGVRQILCLGAAAGTLLASDDQPVAAEYHDWPVIRVCALHEMLAEPAHKADTWRTLQVLVRV